MKKIKRFVLKSVLGSLTLLPIVCIGSIYGDLVYASGGFGGNDVIEVLPNSVPGTNDYKDDSFLDILQKITNWVLGISGLVSLIIFIRAGIMMITAAGDDSKFKKGFTIMKFVGMGLIFIGISWLFLRLVFFVVASSTS